jgi:hypothetical protein
MDLLDTFLNSLTPEAAMLLAGLLIVIGLNLVATASK